MMTVFILDDEPFAIDTLKTYVERIPGLRLAGTATDPLSALPLLTGTDAPNLLLLDVDMPGISGLELAGLLPVNTRVIFVTSFREFGVEAFDLNAVDFLLKPVFYPRFLKAVQKAVATMPAASKPVLFVKGDVKEKYIRVVIMEIRYICAALNYIEIHTGNGKVVTYLTLSEILKELPAADFCQTHRSYIVNRHYITSVEKAQLRLDTGQAVPLGGAYDAAFRNWLEPQVLISKRIRNL